MKKPYQDPTHLSEIGLIHSNQRNSTHWILEQT